MAEFRLTAEQQAVVDNRGRSLLVSAAAGSGKTKVLVERLFSYVEKEGANLDDFLIITYTRAAAAELRGKIAAALSERLQKDPTNAHLRRQMLRVYRADIKTVDAFCTALLRENCHLLGEDAQQRALRPDFRVMDEYEARALKERVLSRVMDDFYEDMDDGAMQLADTLGAGRDDSALAALVLQMHEKLQAQTNREEWIARQRDVWSNIPEQIEKSHWGEILLFRLRSESAYYGRMLQHLAEEMVGDAVLEKSYLPAFQDAAAQLKKLASVAESSWDAVRALLPEFMPLKSSRGCEDPALQSRAKALWDKCKDAMKKNAAAFAVSSADSAADLRMMSGAMLALLDLTSNFSEAYQTEKRRRNSADFSDQEHEAIRLLVGEDGEPSELAREIAQRYREIMVDEYQDTNEVQNCIFSAISREGKNLFTVGDVKQSIYRFRLADPGIFLDHYEKYPAAAEAEEGQSGKLVLSRNFRSRSEVLEATNFVFRGILSREMGELEYGDDEALHLGAAYDQGTADDTEFHLLQLPSQRGKAEKVRAADAEADFVAARIKALLDEGFLVQDGKTMRPVREEDIVILMRNPGRRYETYRRALEARGIRASGGTEDGAFYETIEIAVLYALLQVIDNPRQDVPLITVLRSPLFSFTPDDLARVRAKARSGDFYDALKADESDKSRAFFDLLASLRELAPGISAFELLAHIYDRCGVYAVFGAMEGGALRQENLEGFLEIARTFGGGLFDFLCHLKSLLEIEKAPQPQRGGSAQGVRIMSIHKSKGLEFPVVILCDLAAAFNTQDYMASVLVHPKLGLGPVCVDTVRSIRYPTQAQRAVESALRLESKAEEMRILYVAMTRAKEKLIMVYAKESVQKHLKELVSETSYPVLAQVVEGAKCLGDFILLPLLTRREANELRDYADLETACGTFDDTPWIVRVHDVFAPSEEEAVQEETQESDAVQEETPLCLDALSYVYPYRGETLLPAKLTATQLKGREKDAEIAEGAALPPRLRAIGKPRFVAGETALSPTERGTAVHAALQYLDFSLTGEEQALRSAVDDLAGQKRITPEQAQAIELEKLRRFLESPLAARLRRAETLEREYRFFLLDEAKNYAPDAVSDDRVLVQGVVDCFFEEDGALVVVDFKTDRVSGEALKKRAEEYRPQLEIYAKALSRIFEKPVKEKLLYFFHSDTTVEL